MPSISARKLRLVDTSDIAAPSEASEQEISGVHASALVTTAKIPKAQLDRLRAIRDEVALPTDDEPTVIGRIPPGLAFEAVEAELPDSTVVMRHQPLSLQRPVTPPSFAPVVGIPESTRPQIGPGAFEAARAAREAARRSEQRRTRMKWLVVGIWTAAFALAGSLAWVVGHEHRAPAPTLSQ